MMKYISTKLSRYLIVLGLLCVLGETPVRLYGHLKLIEARHVEASESDLLTFFELAFGHTPVLLTPLGLPLSFFKLSNSIPFANLPLIIGATSIRLVGRSLGGCGS
jgi:hypothetical protein